jgi:hypothetical protein
MKCGQDYIEATQRIATEWSQPHSSRAATLPTPTYPPRVKVKAIPLQALTDLNGSRRLRLPDFKTIGT